MKNSHPTWMEQPEVIVRRLLELLDMPCQVRASGEYYFLRPSRGCVSLAAITKRLEPILRCSNLYAVAMCLEILSKDRRRVQALCSTLMKTAENLRVDAAAAFEQAAGDFPPPETRAEAWCEYCHGSGKCRCPRCRKVHASPDKLPVVLLGRCGHHCPITTK